ncbi:hypothetical protein KCH_76740 [Kitasatospora cheerisanensis KCTC 2395]|uniref:Uncharacterized protein n=1 Tax=Kitasatospora cheerisanensis KCTC 2395 TaxID=1348663 RepID=A0A066YHA7_9ACTN|nr:hypothetical protein KCH_76740 [Kitasatospora cheerisanensis KCTC 2395]
MGRCRPAGGGHRLLHRVRLLRNVLHGVRIVLRFALRVLHRPGPALHGDGQSAVLVRLSAVVVGGEQLLRRRPLPRAQAPPRHQDGPTARRRDAEAARPRSAATPAARAAASPSG